MEIIEQTKSLYISSPLPNEESYAQVAQRLKEYSPEYANKTILIVGHQAIFYSLEYICNRVPLRESISSSWSWQPG